MPALYPGLIFPAAGGISEEDLMADNLEKETPGPPWLKSFNFSKHYFNSNYQTRNLTILTS
jgi:hypothetical protein